jgi:hypothetical protein
MCKLPFSRVSLVVLLAGASLAAVSSDTAPAKSRDVVQTRDVLKHVDSVAPVPLKHFEGPGTLGIGPQGCTLFNADIGKSFAISDIGTFLPGDRVWASGVVDPKSFECFPVILPGLVKVTLVPYIEASGTLVYQPQRCIGVHLDSGATYPIDNVGDFFIGDRVFVRGWLEADSQMCFPVIRDALRDVKIEAFYAGTGTIGVGPQGCVLVHTDDGLSFSISNLGDFFIGDRVYVTGIVDEDSVACFPVILPELVDNTIAAANAD